MRRKDTWPFFRSFSFSSHYPLGRLKCNFIALRRNAMRVQCNGVATQCDCNALQSDCNAYANAMRWGGCNREAVAMRLQRNALRLQCDGTVWPSSSLVLCLSQSPREEGRRRARRGGGEVGSPSWARGPRRREEERCDCNAMRL